VKLAFIIGAAVVLAGCASQAGGSTPPAPAAHHPAWSVSCLITNPTAATAASLDFEPQYTLEITNNGPSASTPSFEVLFWQGGSQIGSDIATPAANDAYIAAGQTFMQGQAMPESLTSPAAGEADYTVTAATRCTVNGTVTP
jgi:hypothetical protein